MRKNQKSMRQTEMDMQEGDYSDFEEDIPDSLGYVED